MNSVVAGPGSIPFAARKTFATPPAVRTLSTTPFVSMCRVTAIESSALIPPKIASFGRSWDSIARETIVISRSITRPARAGITSAKPHRLGWARCAAANASRTKYWARGASRRTIIALAIFSGFASASASSSAKNRVFSSRITSPAFIAWIASIAALPNRLSTYRTGRPKSAAIRSAWDSIVVKSSFPGRLWRAGTPTRARRVSLPGPPVRGIRRGGDRGAVGGPRRGIGRGGRGGGAEAPRVAGGDPAGDRVPARGGPELRRPAPRAGTGRAPPSVRVRAGGRGAPGGGRLGAGPHRPSRRVLSPADALHRGRPKAGSGGRGVGVNTPRLERSVQGTGHRRPGIRPEGHVIFRCHSISRRYVRNSCSLRYFRFARSTSLYSPGGNRVRFRRLRLTSSTFPSREGNA